jgi:hypothetical protein
MSFIKRKQNRHQGQFVPTMPEKYVGRYPIVVRSSWERMYCQWLDKNENVKEWSSEGSVINYYDPIQMKRRRYYPDFWMKVLDKKGNINKYIIEIKPNHETRPPVNKRGKKSSKTMLKQEATYLTNQAKFNAAKQYCDKLGVKFLVLTEKELFR